jgi:hypothetical protein
MIEAFDYKGYRVVITEYLKTFPSSGEGKLNQHISIVGIDNRLTLFLDNTALDDAKAEIVAHIDNNTLERFVQSTQTKNQSPPTKRLSS